MYLQVMVLPHTSKVANKHQKTIITNRYLTQCLNCKFIYEGTYTVHD